MEIGIAITFTVLIIAVVIILVVILYHQMLLVNEVNKRLLLLAKESIERERITMDELQDMIHTQMSEQPTSPAEVEEDMPKGSFDPHEFEEQLP